MYSTILSEVYANENLENLLFYKRNRKLSPTLKGT